MEQNIWNHFKAIYKEFEDAGTFIIFGQGGENCEQLAVNNGILMLERISKVNLKIKIDNYLYRVLMMGG